MSYSTITKPPKNESNYIKTTSENVIVLLQEGTDRIVTSGMIGSLGDAIAFANAKGYQVSMMRCDDPSDPGGAMSLVGTFYFHRQQK